MLADLEPLLADLLPDLGVDRCAIAVALALLTVFLDGSGAAFFTRRGWFASGLEMRVPGAVAAGAAYRIGASGARLVSGAWGVCLRLSGRAVELDFGKTRDRAIRPIGEERRGRLGVPDPDHQAEAAATPGRDAGSRVLEENGALGTDAQPASGLEEKLGVGLARHLQAFGVEPVDANRDKAIEPRRMQDRPAVLAARSDPDPDPRGAHAPQQRLGSRRRLHASFERLPV